MIPQVQVKYPPPFEGGLLVEMGDRTYTVPSLCAASALCRNLIRENQVSQSDWSPPKIVSEMSRDHIANVDYDGVLWCAKSPSTLFLVE